MNVFSLERAEVIAVAVMTCSNS